MRIKLKVVTSIIASTLMLSGCQTLNNKSSESMPVAKKAYSEIVPIIALGKIMDLDTDNDGVDDKLDMCPATPNNVVVDARGCPLNLMLEGALRMEYRGFFTKGSSELSSEYQLELDRIAQKLKEYDTATMLIEGHSSADEIDKSSNTFLLPDSLSMNRALIVKNYLMMQHQIDPDRLSTSSFGAEQPIASSDTEEGKSLNRRVYGIAEEPQN